MRMTTQPTPDLYGTQSTDILADIYSDDGNHTSTLSPPLFIPCDDPRNVVSPFVAETVDFVVYVGIYPVLVICGVIGNVINMAVFARQGLSNRIHLCLFSLAVSDTGFLLSLMCGKSYSLISLVDPVAGSYWEQRHLAVVLGSYLGFTAISNTITALIAVERCLCILSPLKAAKFFKTKYLRVVILVVAVCILVIMNVSLGLKFQTVQIFHPITNTSTFVSRLGPVYLRHRTIIDTLYKQLLSVTLPSSSLIVVIICTTVVAHRLKVAAEWRRRTVSNMTSVEKQEVTVTRMLVTVCCVYVVCMIPNVTRSLLVFSQLHGFSQSGYLCNAFKIILAFTHTLEALNSSVNFCIYMKQSSRYRSTFRQLCNCIATHREKTGMASQQTSCTSELEIRERNALRNMSSNIKC